MERTRMQAYKSLFYQYKGGRGVTAPPPSKGIKRFFFLWYTHFWRLMGLNLLFILFCLPVVTIPPAITALSKVLLNLVREGNTFYIADFFDEFKSSFWKSWAAFIPLLICMGLGVIGFVSIDDVYANAPIIVMYVMVCSIVYCQSAYCFCMIALIDLPLVTIIKNSVIMVLVEMKRNVFMIMTIPVVIVCAIFYIYSIPLTLLLLFSFIGMVNVMVANQAIEERVIQPNMKEREINV